MTSSRAFVMGHPIAHSRSPMLHRYWLKQQGIAGTYEALDIAPDALAAFFAEFRAAGWIGGNVTVPHKLAVIPFLDTVDDDATAMGAVNTIWWCDGKLTGGNTDAGGFIDNLDERAPGWDAQAGKAVLIGAGGAARAATYGLMKRGFSVAVCNRTAARAQALAERFGPAVSGHAMEALPALMEEADVLVNTTSLGMVGAPPLDIDLAPLKARAVVYDIVYAPLETELLKQAAARGNATVDGLGMLLHQAVAGFRRWFGRTPLITAELRQRLAEDIAAKASD